MQTKYRDLDPTVIPAQPGYQEATFFVALGRPDSVDLRPSDLGVEFQPVLAWIIRPTLDVTDGGCALDDVFVWGVTVEGLTSRDGFLVSPSGGWSRPGEGPYADETAARAEWIRREQRRREQAG